jgi:hypothetical protein
MRRRSLQHYYAFDISISLRAALALVSGYAVELGLKVKPHDLRRICAKL